MSEKLVLTAVHRGVAILTLDDPARRNALSPEMAAAIRAAFDWAEDDPDVRAVLLTATPPAFCAGADLSALGDPTRERLLAIYEGFLRVWRSPLVTVAAIGGPAVGAGVNLALACDVRVVSEKARFDVRFLELGLHPGGGHTWLLGRVSPQAVAAMTLCGDVLDGREAARVGLAWRCVPEADLMREARRLAEKAAQAPEELLRRVKETQRQTAKMDDLDEAVALELDRQLWSARQPAFADKIRKLKRK